MRTIIVLLKRYVPSLGWVFVACLALGLLGQIILLAQPQYGGALIQAAQEGANAFDPLIILLILLAASALLTMGQQVLIAKIGEGLAKRIRGRLSRSFFALSVLSQEARPSGWYSQRIVSDVELVKRLPGHLVSLVQSLFVFFRIICCPGSHFPHDVCYWFGVWIAILAFFGRCIAPDVGLQERGSGASFAYYSKNPGIRSHESGFAIL